MSGNQPALDGEHGLLAVEDFKEVMAALPTGITVVTACNGDGAPVGLTVNACTSVSLDPPMLLVCLKQETYTLQCIHSSKSFAVNILDGTQAALAKRFAQSGPGKFEGIETSSGITSAPILPDVLAHAECELAESVRAGDHEIVVGRVVHGRARESEPLVYFRRDFAPLTCFGSPEHRRATS